MEILLYRKAEGGRRRLAFMSGDLVLTNVPVVPETLCWRMGRVFLGISGWNSFVVKHGALLLEVGMGPFVGA